MRIYHHPSLINHSWNCFNFWSDLEDPFASFELPCYTVWLAILSVYSHLTKSTTRILACFQFRVPYKSSLSCHLLCETSRLLSVRLLEGSKLYDSPTRFACLQSPSHKHCWWIASKLNYLGWLTVVYGFEDWDCTANLRSISMSFTLLFEDSNGYLVSTDDSDWSLLDSRQYFLSQQTSSQLTWSCSRISAA